MALIRSGPASHATPERGRLSDSPNWSGGKYLEKKWPCAVGNPLKRPKTAKGIFGKAWRFQAENLEKFGASLEKLAGDFNI